MADNEFGRAHIIAEKRLNTTREAELLQSFVRVNINDDDEGKVEVKEEHVEQQPQIGEENGLADNKPKSATPEDASKVGDKFNQEMKKKVKRRKRKSGPRHEELYCDKDRAAAVNMGSRDIKQSLKLKRKQDRSRALQIPEEAEPNTFLALGNYEMARGDMKIALDFMNKALELNPEEKNALVARSKCYILLGQPENALKDAEAALQTDKKFLKAIYQKAESLYFLGDFEHSLMYYHRGLHIRPDHEDFKLGVHKAQKAIENALGSSFLQIIRDGKSRNSLKENNMPKESIASESSRSKTNRSSARPKTAKKSKLLRELGADKEYLDNLMNNPAIKCKYKEDDTAIEKCIEETVEFLNKRQEFWRQQLPFNLKH